MDLENKNLTSSFNFIEVVQKYWNYLFIILAAVIVYLPTLSFAFSPLDDEWLIVKRIDLYRDLSSLKVFFSEAILDNYYRPIWVVSYMPDVMIGGSNPMVFHFFNIVYHAIASVLLFVVFQKLGLKRNIAFGFSLLFAVHPLHVQSVAFVPGRVDVLLAIFSFSVFIFFLNYLENFKIKNLLFCTLFTVLALFTKENAIVLPILFTGYYILINKKTIRKEIIYLFAILVAIVGVWFFIRHQIIPVYLPADNLSFFNVFQDMALATVMYFGKIILPINQSVAPTVAETSMLPFYFVIALLITIVFYFKFSNKRLTIFGIFWFFTFIIIPLIAGSMRSGAEHFEQRAYLPMVGVFIMLSQINFSKIDFFNKKIITWIFFSIIALLFFVKTFIRSDVYKNPYQLATTGIEEAPHSIYYYIILGRACVVNNLPEEAIKWYDAYIEKRTNSAIPYANKGAVYLGMKQYDKAIESFNVAITLEPGNTGFYKDRARAFYFSRKFENALIDIQQYKKMGGEVDKNFEEDVKRKVQLQNEIIGYSIQITSDTATDYSYIKRGMAYFTNQDYANSINDFSSGLKLNPKSQICLLNRGWVYEVVGKLDSAKLDYIRLEKLGHPLAPKALEKLNEKMGLKISEPTKNP